MLMLSGCKQSRSQCCILPCCKESYYDGWNFKLYRRQEVNLSPYCTFYSVARWVGILSHENFCVCLTKLYAILLGGELQWCIIHCLLLNSIDVVLRLCFLQDICYYLSFHERGEEFPALTYSGTQAETLFFRHNPDILLMCNSFS